MTRAEFEVLKANCYAARAVGPRTYWAAIEDAVAEIVSDQAPRTPVVAAIRACDPITVVAYIRGEEFCARVGARRYTVEEVETMLREHRPEWFEPAPCAPWNAPPHPSRDCDGAARKHLLSLRAEVEGRLDADDIALTVSCSRCGTLGTASLVYDHIDWERDQPEPTP